MEILYLFSENSPASIHDPLIMLTTDVLIIGSGIAGGTAALTLADAGVPVTLITRAREAKRSSTLWAQGGIIYRGAADPDALVEDILAAGAGHGDREAARILATEGPALLREILIERLEVPFERDPRGEVATIREAAHSQRGSPT